MRFGVCAPIAAAERLAALGFDYVEVHAGQLSGMSEAEFAAFCAENAAAPIRAEAANCLFPGEMRLVGPDADFEQIAAYLDHTLARLGAANIPVVSFGSGGSRRVPEGFDRETAHTQLVRVAKLLGDTAEKYGVTVALEPLRRIESNSINTLAEGCALVDEVGHPHFKLLCDYFHVTEEGTAVSEVGLCGERIAHVHIAAPVTRKVMREEDGADYDAFFTQLRTIGYDACISFEGSVNDYEAELPYALAVMKRA